MKMKMKLDANGRLVCDQPREIFYFEGIKINRCEICKNPKRHKSWCAEKWEEMQGVTREDNNDDDDDDDDESDFTTKSRKDAPLSSTRQRSVNTKPIADAPVPGTRIMRPCPYCPCTSRKHLARETKSCKFYPYFKRRMAEEAEDPVNKGIARRVGEKPFEACVREYAALMAKAQPPASPAKATSPKMNGTGATSEPNSIMSATKTVAPATKSSAQKTNTAVPATKTAAPATTTAAPATKAGVPTTIAAAIATKSTVPATKSAAPATKAATTPTVEPKTVGTPAVAKSTLPTVTIKTQANALRSTASTTPTSQQSKPLQNQSQPSKPPPTAAPPANPLPSHPSASLPSGNTPSSSAVPYSMQIPPQMSPYMWYVPATMAQAHQQMTSMMHPPTAATKPQTSAAALPAHPSVKQPPAMGTRPQTTSTADEAASRKRKAEDDSQDAKRRHDLLVRLLSAVERDQDQAKRSDEEMVKLQLERLEFDRQLQRERFAFDRDQAEKAQKRFEANQVVIKQILAELGPPPATTTTLSM
ncbi:Aste57867_16845 [Aphanomyces stellatus]|uniref:Aste57867_16845 protein n=1 Tax=Aphanomyces stellatus TaxID=120398 RepID=A0A485L761_9STRA|nr:hypothetical protein As57867_016787 [Aphanomyces stellatus]VFT93609.1 Aste57867_16845 [Aphanomyces stellatus]